MDTINLDETSAVLSRNEHNNRTNSQKKLVICLILASTAFERTAYYSLAANFTPSLQLSNSDSCSDDIPGSLVFSAISYLSTLIFAILSDAKFGRAKTIILGFILYIIGFALTIIFTKDTLKPCNSDISNKTNISCHQEHKFYDQNRAGINIALIIIAIGASAVKSNLSVFGAEQNQESEVTARYYDKYFVAVNIGIIAATLVIPYLSVTEGYNSRIIYEFAIATIIAATITFMLGYKYYLHTEPYDSVITNCFPVFINAFQTWRQHRSERSLSGQQDSNDPTSEEHQIILLDYAKLIHHGRFNEHIVEDVKCLRKAFMVFALLIPYWVIYNQLYTSFPSQGKCMHGSESDYIIFWMSLGDPITIIIGVILLNAFFYRYLNAKSRPLTTINKLVLGMIFASLTMCFAGVVQILRQHNQMNDSSTLSIYTQLGPTMFMGISELFGTIACFEYSYFNARRSSQSLFMSLYFCTVGLASLIGTGCIQILSLDFSSSSSNNYVYFFVLAGIQLLFVVIFIRCERNFRIIEINT